ncbi:protein LBH isoform X1 [Trachinotus anak]|uniref:protein LBH isoform X1 n=1 Tax=Trachinotus anak TaxID=443729 RepID=UPI0039F23230
MSCIPASHSMSTILSQVESQMEESSVQRRGSRTYQIFPEANMNEESDSSSYPEDFLYRRERLPSIVVEPTEHSELQSRELRWPPRCLMSNNLEEEEEDSSADHTEGSVDREQQEDMRTDEGCQEVFYWTVPESIVPLPADPTCLSNPTRGGPTLSEELNEYNQYGLILLQFT